MNEQAITGIILAGGQGSRMGGVDKGLQALEGKPLIAWVAERLQPQVDKLLISANRNLAAYQDWAAHWGARVIQDQEAGFRGPLAGLEAGLLQADTPWVLTVPCDSPNFPLDLVTRLHTAALETGAPAVHVRSAGRDQPTFCLYRRELAPALSDYLNRGERRLMGWLESIQASSLDFPDGNAFINLNTLEDLAKTGVCKTESPT